MNTLTETEAAIKACCSGSNRPVENGWCIGSSCMAWRWTGAEKERSSGAADVDLAIAVRGTADQRAELQRERLARRTGYCGLSPLPKEETQ